MRTLEEAMAYIQNSPAEEPVRFLNECFGHFGWELRTDFEGTVLVKAMIKVPEGVLSISREAPSLKIAVDTFRIQKEAPSAKDEPPEEVQQAVQEPPVAEKVPTRPRREIVNKSIAMESEVIVGRKLKTKEELRALVAAFGAQKKEQLSDDQALTLLEQLKQINKQEK